MHQPEHAIVLAVGPDGTEAARSFAVARLRALTPTQYATSLRIAVADPDQLPASLPADELDRRIEGMQNGARGFAAMLDQPRDDFQIGVSEALLFSNGDRVQREYLQDGKDRILGRMAKMNAEEAVEFAVRNVLTRAATADEKQAMVDYVAKRQDRRAEAYKQMVWALLTSAEFRVNY